MLKCFRTAKSGHFSANSNRTIFIYSYKLNVPPEVGELQHFPIQPIQKMKKFVLKNRYLFTYHTVKYCLLRFFQKFTSHANLLFRIKRYIRFSCIQISLPFHCIKPLSSFSPNKPFLKGQKLFRFSRFYCFGMSNLPIKMRFEMRELLLVLQLRPGFVNY